MSHRQTSSPCFKLKTTATGTRMWQPVQVWLRNAATPFFPGRPDDHSGPESASEFSRAIPQCALRCSAGGFRQIRAIAARLKFASIRSYTKLQTVVLAFTDTGCTGLMSADRRLELLVGYHPLALMPPPKSTRRKPAPVPPPCAGSCDKWLHAVQPNGFSMLLAQCDGGRILATPGALLARSRSAAGAGLLVAGLLHAQAGAAGAGVVVVVVVELFESLIIIFVSGLVSWLVLCQPPLHQRKRHATPLAKGKTRGIA